MTCSADDFVKERMKQIFTKLRELDPDEKSPSTRAFALGFDAGFNLALLGAMMLQDRLTEEEIYAVTATNNEIRSRLFKRKNPRHIRKAE